jgi:hypothetical protein
MERKSGPEAICCSLALQTGATSSVGNENDRRRSTCARKDQCARRKPFSLGRPFDKRNCSTPDISAFSRGRVGTPFHRPASHRYAVGLRGHAVRVTRDEARGAGIFRRRTVWRVRGRGAWTLVAEPLRIAKKLELLAVAHAALRFGHARLVLVGAAILAAAHALFAAVEAVVALERDRSGRTRRRASRQARRYRVQAAELAVGIAEGASTMNAPTGRTGEGVRFARFGSAIELCIGKPGVEWRSTRSTVSSA